MDTLQAGNYTLTGLGPKNILLGKNGCGKSRLLKQAEQALRASPDAGSIRYLSPERAGVLQ